MTNGDPSGMTGRVFWRGYAAVMAYVAILNIVNVMTIRQDEPDLPWIFPVVTEASSGLAAAGVIWIAWLTFRLAPLDSRPVWRMLAIQAMGLTVFSAAHVFGFYLLRMATFGLLQIDYDYDLIGRFPYELRKDAVGYLMGMTTFWLLVRLERAESRLSGQATYDIRDGGRVIRVVLADILAVSSAGNYVEFALVDGRKPLMRSSLAAIEGELAAKGFVRTHRSWLVNVARVTELRPEKSGDYRVALGPIDAPLSRRFPEALARLRAG